MQKIICLILLLLNTHHFLASGYIPNAFHPPMKIKPVVSGVFGELRTNHFHSGMDFSTGGKIGYPLFSVESGYVSRIKTSPTGYGKAIYIAHPNGLTSVYGHLSKYADKIDSLLIKKQYEQQSYAIDLQLTQEEIPVKRGEVIGYSGNSGSSGGPHLHFELRHTESQKPINPYFFQNKITDNTRPTIEGIMIFPRDPNTTINGKKQPRYYSAVFYDGAFHLKGKPRITIAGEFGIGVKTIDYLSGSWRKCGVYSISLKENNNEIFFSQLDSFAFDESRYINSHIAYDQKIATGKRIQKSFIEANNQLSIYNRNLPDRKNLIEKGKQNTYTYNIIDSEGNVSTLAFNIHGGQKHPITETVATNKQHVIKFNQPFSQKSNGISISIPSNSFYTDTEFSFNNIKDSIYQIGKTTIPIHNYYNLKIDLPPHLHNQLKKVCLAQQTPKGNKYFIASAKHSSNGVFSTQLRHLGNFCFVVDSIPPSIRLTQIPPNKNYKNRQHIVAKISDRFSGIETYNCFIDSQWILFEFDAKTSLLKCPLKKAPIKRNTTHQLKIVCTDRAGNVKTYETKIFY